MIGGTTTPQRARFLALNLLTDLGYVVIDMIGNEVLSKEIIPRIDEIRALLLADVALANKSVTQSS